MNILNLLPTPRRSRASMLGTVMLALAAAACSDATSPQADAVPGTHERTGWAERSLTFTTVDVPGAIGTSVLGIGPGGDLVGRFVDAAGRTHGFLLDGDRLTVIDYPGAEYTEALGIGPGGEVVGSYRLPGEPTVNLHGFLRTRAGAFARVDYPGHTNTVAQRLLPDGTILGCYHDNDQMATMRGIVFGRDEITEIDLFGSMTNGATPDRRLIVGLYMNASAGRMEGFALEDGVVTPLVVPGSDLTTAWDVNPRGDIVGFHLAGGTLHGFLLTDDGYVTLDAPGAVATRAFAVNAARSIAGDFVDAGGRRHGFVATPAVR